MPQLLRMMYAFGFLLISSANVLLTSARNHTIDRSAYLDHSFCSRRCFGYSNNEERSSETSYDLCRCDSLCQRFGDCCQNFPRSFSMLYEWPNFRCRQVTHGGVYEITSCPLYWAGPDNIRNKCESSNHRDVKDPLSSVPLSNAASSLTYRNLYCALCNGETLENLVFWDVHFGIPGLTRYNLSYGNISMDYPKDALTFNEKTGKWGLSLWVAQKHSSVFFAAYIWFDITEDLYRKTRSCVPHIISGCRQNWAEDVEAKMCKEFLDPHYLQNSHVNRIYRNVHCATCNGESLEELSCFKRKRGTPRPGAAFSVRFDINLQNQKSNGSKVINGRCDYGHIYDPFFKKCRTFPDANEVF